ncbi:dihydropteroate synthase [Leptobacterium flavescens]|uniref:Dihydropteroate synthase n=1 Tax=Leptobacterium flavescens TaxID=472055 RepID=A0A6P0UU08_9FLAO|nr:dihydropteroate synthase [Leptobacterium flavescens]NER15319.1 dihydropteroate synthase [Leptobacterium flavescens]
MTINCQGQLIDLSSPKIMGILNLTPDSFYDGGKYKDEASILQQVEKMLGDGASFIDVGAYSSRPGASYIDEETELQRILPVTELLIKKFPEIILSIDTFRSGIARKCIEAGASIVNDISAGNLDTAMMQAVAELQVPYIMMHMKGTPENMQDLAQYDDVVKDLLFYFSEKIAHARELGINDLIIDPGFGFGKTLEHNYEILSKLELFHILELPLLVGVSRKSMIYKLLEIGPEEALNGTSSLHTVALLKKAAILRVHDVKEAVECVRLVDALGL